MGCFISPVIGVEMALQQRSNMHACITTLLAEIRCPSEAKKRRLEALNMAIVLIPQFLFSRYSVFHIVRKNGWFPEHHEVPSAIWSTRYEKLSEFCALTVIGYRKCLRV